LACKPPARSRSWALQVAAGLAIRLALQGTLSNVTAGVMTLNKLAFDAAGISIPFPQRDVHMISAPAANAASVAAQAPLAAT